MVPKHPLSLELGSCLNSKMDGPYNPVSAYGHRVGHKSLIHLLFRISYFSGKEDGCNCFPSSLCITLALVPCFQQAQAGKIIFLFESLLNLAEIADGSSPFASQRDLLQLTVSSIRSDGNKRGRSPGKNTASGRTAKGDETKIPQSSDGKSSNSSNQEEIIALFRRIQSSITKGKSVVTKKKSPSSSEDKPSAESVLEVLRQSRKQVKDKTSNQEDGKVLTRKRGVPKREQRKQENSTVLEFKSTRPPSNFVKRSPIPHLTPVRGKVVELNGETLSATGGGEELLKVEAMKLPELKELAKSRGLKRYSRLKKSELVELLRS